jgi:myo-inositol 2-dehydrogenase/D-chiro-inositol 1-dehydrogenase
VACLCEKPLTLDLAGSRRLRELVTGSPARVQVGFQRRFDPDVRRLWRAVRQGDVGTVRRLHLTSADRDSPPPEFRGGSGGIFRDLLIHDFDLAQWLTGAKVAQVWAIGSAAGDPAWERSGDVHNAACLLALTDGTIATVQGSRDNGGGHDVRVEVAGSAATLAAGADSRAAWRSVTPGVSFPDGEPWEGFLDRFAAAYQHELDAFVGLAIDGGQPQCGVAEAFDALAIAEAADRSRRQQRTVSLEEVTGLGH